MKPWTIYWIVNGNGEPVYVGRTSRTLEARLISHFYAVKYYPDRKFYGYLRDHPDEPLSIFQYKTGLKRGEASKEEVQLIGQLKKAFDLQQLVGTPDGHEYWKKIARRPARRQQAKELLASRMADPVRRKAMLDAQHSAAAIEKNRQTNIETAKRPDVLARALVNASLGGHVKNHVNRGRVSPTCDHCKDKS